MNVGRVTVKSLKSEAYLADKCQVADSYFVRLRGLIGRSGLRPGEGLLFPRCNSIHMWFMRFPIDVVFLRVEKEADGRLVRRVSSAHSNIRPWRIFPLTDWSSSETLELPVGAIARARLQAGDELCIS